MSFGYYYNLNNNPYFRSQVNFKANGDIAQNAPLSKPIETVQKSIENSVDIFVKKVDEEKKKKSNKKAIAVGSSVLVVTALVALLNPKYSSKAVTKLKSWSQAAGNRLEKSKNDYLASKFHKICQKTFDWGVRTLEFSNNINAAKDIGFTWLCCEKKGFNSIKNKTARKALQKADSGFVKIMKKAHKGITSWFDSISKKTVYSKYNSASKKLNDLEALIKQYKTKVSPAQQKELDLKLAEITKAREFFSKSNTSERFLEQEKLMQNLERDFMSKFRSYRNGFTNKWVSKPDHIDRNMSYWAEDILKPSKEKVEREGIEAVEKIFGNGKDKVGLYDDIYNILSPNLDRQEKEVLEKLMGKTSKKLRNANYSECIEYFDKKRDLILGSAPTDILTAVVGLGFSGVAVARADSKDERISRLLTTGFPVVAGIGASLAFTAMLFSGVQALLYGFLSSIALSKIGSLADHHILGNKKDDIEEIPKPTNNPFQPQEVKYA